MDCRSLRTAFRWRSSLTTFAAVALVLGISSSVATAQPCDTWQPLGSGLNSDAHALAVYNGELIAGGFFTAAGGVSVAHIARWNDMSWQPLGSGISGFFANSPVFALTAYNGELIAGGEFTIAGAVSANRIARWNGASWQPLGSGMNGTVRALAVYNGELIAGGFFTTAGGGSANRIARWNGSVWQPLGVGVNITVHALTVYNGELIAGGSFTTAGGQSANKIARWNGTSWQPLGSGMNNGVSALTVYNSELIAGGDFTTAGGVSAHFIARWNGTSWQPLGVGMNDWIAALAGYNGELIAGGGFTAAGGGSANRIARWNGTSWQPLGVGMNDWVYALAGYNGELIAGGIFTTADGASANYIAKWDDCVSDCPPGLIADCNGNCAPASWIGDGLCDEGTYSWDGIPIFFNCEEFNNDGTDCDPPLKKLDEEPSAPNPPQQDVSDEADLPAPQDDHLVYITHGRATSPTTFDEFWDQVKQEIAAEIAMHGTPGNWNVQAWDWTANSNYNIFTILSYAKAEGIKLGDAIIAMMATNPFEHIHLIGHSAGAMVITKAADKIRAAFPSTIIHTTFLDAYVGVTGTGDNIYGATSNWSDQYYSRESTTPFTDCLLPTGFWTQFHLDHAYNVDVSLLDQTYNPITCLSSHHWPYCFYRHSVSGNAGPCGPPLTDNYLPFGFNLSKEIQGAAWASTIASYPPTGGNCAIDASGNCVADATASGVAGGDDSTGLVLFVRHDPPLNIGAMPFVVSDPTDVQIADSGLDVVMKNDNAASQATWINIQLDNPQVINFITLNLSFTSNPGAEGLLTVYIDGHEFGRVDERFAETAGTLYEFSTAGDYEPGMHILSLRLDKFSTATSNVLIENIATGYGTFVTPGDLNGDGAVNGFDLALLLGAWGTCPKAGACPADLNGDGVVNGFDLAILLGSWG